MKKGRKKEIFEGIVGIIIVIAFVYLMVWMTSKPTSISNDFCEDLGYEKATDEYSEGFKVLSVECDKEDIFHVCEKKECVEQDKWGNCFNKLYLEIQNGTNGDCKR